MIEEMTPSNNGLHLTKQFEQCRLVAYWDALGHVFTIAWGHTYGVYEGLTCTQLEADCWLVEDYAFAVKCVCSRVTVALTQGEFDALCDFVFNLGGSNFAHSTLLQLLNSGNYTGAAREFDRWDHASGKVCQGLLRRREAETSEFEGRTYELRPDCDVGCVTNHTHKGEAWWQKRGVDV